MVKRTWLQFGNEAKSHMRGWENWGNDLVAMTFIRRCHGQRVEAIGNAPCNLGYALGT